MNEKRFTNEDYNDVLNYFKKNETRKTTGLELQRMFDMNVIKLQGIIHRIRTDGHPILSYGNYGYSYNTDKDEIIKCYMSLMGRATSIIKAASGIMNFIEEGNKDGI